MAIKSSGVILIDRRFIAKQYHSEITRMSDEEMRATPLVMGFGGIGHPADLAYGDINFWSFDGKTTVVVEVKGGLDLAVCVGHTGRLAQQMEAALAAGGGNTRYVVMLKELVGPDNQGTFCTMYHGTWRPVILPGSRRPSAPDGRVLMWRQVDNYLNTLELKGGAQVKMAAGEAATVKTILDLYWWWQKPMEEHGSIGDGRVYNPIFMPVATVPLVRRWARELEGMGVDRSRSVADHFRSAYKMATATVEDWKGIAGIGPVLANRWFQEIHKDTGSGRAGR